MGQYLVGGFVIIQVFSHWRIMGQAHNCFPVFSRYHYLADQFSFILQSHMVDAIFWSILRLSWNSKHEPSLPPLLCQDVILSPRLYLERICVPCLLNNEAYRHRYVKRDRWHQQKHVCFNSTSLVSMVPCCNKVSFSSSGLFLDKVTAHAEKKTCIFLFILFITNLLGYYWVHHSLVTGQVDTK